MAKWVNAEVLDDGINVIRNQCTQQRLLSAYEPGDSFATVNANTLATAAMVADDFALGTAGSNRTLTTAAGKTATASATSGASPDLHIAFVNLAGTKVLWVTDETSNQVVTSGNQITFPPLVYTSQQPI